MAIKVQDDETEAFSQVQRRQHPVRALLEQAAQGGKPTAEQAAAVVQMADPADRAAVRRRLFETVTQCHELRNAGALGPCRRLAHDVAFELAPMLGPYRPPAEDLPTDPRGLAARIGRGPSAVGPPAR